MKQKQANKTAERIYESMVTRITEIVERAVDKNLNGAYLVAFQIGLISDIEDVLKKVRKIE